MQLFIYENALTTDTLWACFQTFWLSDPNVYLHHLGDRPEEDFVAWERGYGEGDPFLSCLRNVNLIKLQNVFIVCRASNLLFENIPLFLSNLFCDPSKSYLWLIFPSTIYYILHLSLFLFFYTFFPTSYQRYRLRPRILRGINNIDMSCSLLGREINFPIGLAPTACCRFAHSEKEIGTCIGEHLPILYQHKSANICSISCFSYILHMLYSNSVHKAYSIL